MKRELNFENFYVYEGNKVAYLAAQKIIELPGELFNPLYVYGGTGLGKTHFLWALYSELNKKFTTLFFSGKEFEKYLEETKLFDTPIIVDDLHTIAGRYHEAILGIIDSLLASNKQICFSGNAAPRDLKNLEAKLRSHLEGGLVCDISPPKEIALVDMIKKKSGEAGILLPDEVALELAQISTSSIRAIEGMINRLVAYSSLGNLSLDISSVRMILKEFYPKGIYSPVSSLLEELKKNASEVLQDVSEKLDIHEEYKEKMYIWEMKGFDTSSLKTLLDGDIDFLKKEYDIFIRKVEKLVELQKEYGSLDTSNFPDEAMKIESMLFSPEHLDEIEELIAKIKEEAQKAKFGKTFETFIVGKSNETAYNICRSQILSNLGERFNPFIVLGEKGTGKTHFLEAIYSDLKSMGKSALLCDFAKDISIPEEGNVKKIDVLIFDNFSLIFSAPDDSRKRIFEIILDRIKNDKEVIFSSDVFPSDLSLSEEEKVIFELGLEVNLEKPSSDVMEAYIKSKLELEEADEIIKKGLPEFASFYELDEFLESPKTEERAEVVSLGLPGEESEEERAEVVSLGLPGEESEQEKEVVEEEIEEAVVKEKSEGQTSGEKLAVAKGMPLKDINEERFILQEILGELIEDNY